MGEPEKPFACGMPDCGMTFTNEDHLNVHTKKHDMVLQFGCEQKAAVFVADQTPTPTRFIRNCEEVGLFQDLQNVNPFDEGFKRAIETKQGLAPLEAACGGTELHTPQMFPLEADAAFCRHDAAAAAAAAAGSRRSSSDDNGIKELETTRISKLTNEVTTIRRIVEKHDDSRATARDSVSYNNVIQVQSNVEITAAEHHNKHSGKTFDRLQADVPPIMSQKSIDFVVDSLTSDFAEQNGRNVKTVDIKDNITKDSNIRDVEGNSHQNENMNQSGDKKKPDYEVILKLPSGQQIKLVNEDKDEPKNTKDLLKKVISEKVESQKMLNTINVIPSVIPTLLGGTLIPVSIVNLPKLPLKVEKKPVRRKSESCGGNGIKKRKEERGHVPAPQLPGELEGRSAASRRYRARLKETMAQQSLQNKLLKERNERLTAERAALRALILDHVASCHSDDDLRELQEQLSIIEGRR